MTDADDDPGRRRLEQLAGAPAERPARAPASELVLGRRTLGGRLARIAGGDGHPDDADGRLSQRGRAIAAALAAAEAPAAVSGLDVLGDYALQLSGPWPALVYARRGSGSQAAAALRELGRPLLDPTPATLGAAVGDRELLVIRERPLARTSGRTVRRAEDAWVDLVLDVRCGYPLEVSTLAELAAGLARDPDISWRYLVRQGRRRAMPVELVTDRPLPFELDPAAGPFWARLADAVTSL